MRRFVGSITITGAAVVLVASFAARSFAQNRGAAQPAGPSRPAAPATGPRIPRGPDGKPNFNGIWQAMNSANWDLLPHAATKGPLAALGAWGGEPAGLGVVDGDEIPYKPEALAKKKQNAAKRLELDPEVKCYLPGVPRAMYLPYPFQIVQTPASMLMVFEYASAARDIDMQKIPDAPVDTWMGYAGGYWEGDTLVIDTKGFNEQSWLDRAGDFHSDKLHVVERLTMTSPDAINYEATLDDSKVFTRPWKIRMPLYRRLEKNAQILEYKCPEFAEELMYGHLVKPGAPK
jgi:hypothetical protein